MGRDNMDSNDIYWICESKGTTILTLFRACVVICVQLIPVTNITLIRLE